MNILIENSQGEILTIPVRETDTFRELNARTQKDYGLQMDFTNLQGTGSIDFDENIIATLSKNDQLVSMEAKDYISEQIKEDSNESAEKADLVMEIERREAARPNEIDLRLKLEHHAMAQSPESEEFAPSNPECKREGEDANVVLRDTINSEDSASPEGTNDQQISAKSAASIVLENIDKVDTSVCRLCACSGERMLSIFGSSKLEREITRKIDDCLPIMVQRTDVLSKQVCRSCLEKLDTCYEFHKTVVEAESRLLRMRNVSKFTRKRCEAYEQRMMKVDRISEKVDNPTDSSSAASPLKIGSKRNATDAASNGSSSSGDFNNEENRDFERKRRTESTDDILLDDKTSETEQNASSVTAMVEIAKSATSETSNGAYCRNGRKSDRSKAPRKIGRSQPKARKPGGRVDFTKKMTKLAARAKKSKISRETDAEEILAGEETLSNRSCSDSEESPTVYCRKFASSGDCTVVKCRICEESFATTAECHSHSGVHAGEDYHPCSLCEKTYATEEECSEHFVEHTEGKRCERRSATHGCDECGKKFVTKERLQFHETFHSSDARPCYCEKCDKFMVSESSLYHHLLTVHLQYKEFCCDICGKQFRAQAQLDAHQRKHKDERPFECTICKKRFYSSEILKRHKKLHLPDKPYQCDQCGKRFDRTNSLTKHLLRHQAETGRSAECYVCAACEEIFPNPFTANAHLTKCRPGEEDGQIERRNFLALYRCEFCERCFAEIKSMKAHRVGHAGPQPYVCTKCDTSYATYNQATAHKSAHKKSSKNCGFNEDIPVPKYFCCGYCNKHFLHYTNMNIHRKACAAVKHWRCRYCGSVFANARDLSKHKRGKQNPDAWTCEECGLTFGSVCALETHKETHSEAFAGRKTYGCSYCGKEFIQKSHLTVHIRSHTGERPFACDLCEKTYKIKAERDNHRRTHTGERPYKCTICDKTFTNPARLREHTRFHTGVRPYKCEICEKAFKKANAKKVHMTIHTGEKPYQCDVCNTYFRRMGDMRKHRRTQHEL